MTPQRVPSQTAQLAIREWGEDGAPILALHPGVGDSRIWHWCAPAWAAAGHRVVAYDRRGFGSTDYIEEPHNDLSDLMAVTEATNTRPAIVVGNSKGGGLALDLALARPHDVEALVLIAPSPSGYDYTTWESSAAEVAQDTLIEAAEQSGDLDMLNRLEVRYWLDGVDQTEGRVSGSPRELLTEMNRRALDTPPTGETEAQADAWPSLPMVHAPALVIAGDHDLPGVTNMCREIAELMPNCELSIMPDSAHCPMLDDPHELTTLVLDFLRGLR